MKHLRHLITGTAAFAMLAAVAATGPSATAQDRPGQRPAARGERMHGAFFGAPLISIALRNQTELKLAADQVSNLEKIKSQYESQVTPLRQQLTAVENEIATLMQHSPVNLVQVKTKVEQGEKYRSELRYLRLEALENARGVLTSEQQEQLKTMIRARHENGPRMQRQPS
jgi:Spy/CpxP family protein refolding chaperone